MSGHYSRLFSSAWLVGLTVKLDCCVIKIQSLARLRYFFGGDRPSQTARFKLSLKS